MPRLRPTRRAAALAFAVLGLAGLSAASASQLAVDGGTIQSGVGLVVDCQPAGTPIRVELSSAFTSGAYRTTGVRFSGVDEACDGLRFRMQLISTTGTVIDIDPSTSATDVGGSVGLAGGVFTVPVPSTPTTSIGTVALVVTD
ncbi:hypothetical protein OEB99_12180 [Actinotalea sp. M2MS4P-6]|uniref:hypothetical protein n=1 Tax=Actinotalea sp. M2MS4P-6 TaxID=2983762 RepID=UPI0021E3B3AF|nr:hypothetical protein [Actinotalea sp. M2MS4P-6]MCV2395067.1 hypothetical protein [Actinotalea sp. M2MS4P-6]